MSQLCKTNPIPKTPESPQSLLPQRLTPIFAFTPVKKTNPNKPNPATLGKHRVSSIQHQVSSPVYAKQTQFPKGQNQRNFLCHKDLQQYSAPLCPQKTNPNKANPPNAIRNTQHAIRKTNPIKPKTLTAGTKSCPERPVVSKVEPSRRDAIRDTRYEPCTTAAGQP